MATIHYLEAVEQFLIPVFHSPFSPKPMILRSPKNGCKQVDTNFGFLIGELPRLFCIQSQFLTRGLSVTKGNMTIADTLSNIP